MTMMIEIVNCSADTFAKVVEGSVAQKQGGILPNDQVIEVTFFIIIGIIAITIIVIMIVILHDHPRLTDSLSPATAIRLTSIATMIIITIIVIIIITIIITSRSHHLI